MARKLRLEFKGAIYHVTFRGNGRQNIFRSDADRRRLLERMEQSINDFGVRLYAYCLMSNHVHLLAETPRGNLSRFMSSVLTGYSVYFNRRHRRVGHLMQGRYGAKLVEGSEYLLGVSRYIHLNPLRTAAMRNAPIPEQRKYLRRYRWSSYRGYAGLGKVEDWVDRNALWTLSPGRGSRAQRYRCYVEVGLAATDGEFEELMRSSPLAVGSTAFVERAKTRYAERVSKARKQEDVALRRMDPARSPEEVIRVVCTALGIHRTELGRKRRDSTNRAIAAQMLVRYAGLTQRKAATRLGIRSGAAVSYLLRSLRERMKGDRRLRQLMTSLDHQLGSRA